jgi:hypothetical protein
MMRQLGGEEYNGGFPQWDMPLVTTAELHAAVAFNKDPDRGSSEHVKTSA